MALTVCHVRRCKRGASCAYRSKKPPLKVSRQVSDHFHHCSCRCTSESSPRSSESMCTRTPVMRTGIPAAIDERSAQRITDRCDRQWWYAVIDAAKTRYAPLHGSASVRAIGTPHLGCAAHRRAHHEHERGDFKVGSNGFKKSLRHDNPYLRIGHLTPESTELVPRTVTAACGMDAVLTQPIECLTTCLTPSMLRHIKISKRHVHLLAPAMTRARAKFRGRSRRIFGSMLAPCRNSGVVHGLSDRRMGSGFLRRTVAPRHPPPPRARQHRLAAEYDPHSTRLSTSTTAGDATLDATGCRHATPTADAQFVRHAVARFMASKHNSAKPSPTTPSRNS